MALTKIHCDFLEVVGPDWSSLDQDAIECILNEMHTMELLGDEPELRGFVGTQQIDNIIGGFFAIQYEDERLYYDRKKHPERKQDTPFERVFFVFFAETGKLMLQNRMFADIPLNMTIVERLFREALTEVLQRCEVGYVLAFNLPELRVSNEQFAEEFRRSTRVIQLSVIDPDPDKIPEDFVYYNPQRERNKIIRASHRHDYPNFKKVDLEASPEGDIRSTHIGSDLLVASKPQVMRYLIEEEERILRREMPAKLEFRVDMDAVELSAEHLRSILQMLHRESALDLDIPTSARSGPVQEHFFDKLHGAHNGEN